MTPLAKTGLIIIFILFIIKFTISPLSNWIADEKNNISTIRKNIELSKALIPRSNDIQAQLEDATLKLNDIERLFFVYKTDPDEIKIKLQKNIEELALKNSVEIKRTKWLTSIKKKNYSKIPIQFKVVGYEKNVIMMIKDIESFKKKYLLEQVSISSNVREEKISMTFVVICFGILK